jgi:hypothetical protein
VSGDSTFSATACLTAFLTGASLTSAKVHPICCNWKILMVMEDFYYIPQEDLCRCCTLICRSQSMLLRKAIFIELISCHVGSYGVGTEITLCTL